MQVPRHEKSQSALWNILANPPKVATIEPEQGVTLASLQTQNGSTWGLASTSHRKLGAKTYDYDESAGQGTFAYVLDTGIFVEHTDFGGRAVWGYNSADSDDNDVVGHGTHVAGTIGSSTYGVAKKTTLVAVKMFKSDGSADTSMFLRAFDWAVHHIIDNDRVGKSVINLSLSKMYKIRLTAIQ